MLVWMPVAHLYQQISCFNNKFGALFLIAFPFTSFLEIFPGSPSCGLSEVLQGLRWFPAQWKINELAAETSIIHTLLKTGFMKKPPSPVSPNLTKLELGFSEMLKKYQNITRKMHPDWHYLKACDQRREDSYLFQRRWLWINKWCSLKFPAFLWNRRSGQEVKLYRSRFINRRDITCWKKVSSGDFKMDEI